MPRKDQRRIAALRLPRASVTYQTAYAPSATRRRALHSSLLFASLLSFLIVTPATNADLADDITPAARAILKKGDWHPTEKQTEKALKAIGKFLQNPVSAEKWQWQREEIRKIWNARKDYWVQFGGRLQNGKKVIWCNFYPCPVQKSAWPNRMTEEEYQVFDGGYGYWQIDYDVESDTCANFGSNGYA